MAREIKIDDSYLDKLLKLIPSEIVAGYIAIYSIAQDHTNEETIILVSSIALLILIPFILRFLQNVTKWGQIVFSMIAFVIWVYSLGGPFEAYGIHDPVIGSVIIIFYTFLIPFAVKPEP